MRTSRSPHTRFASLLATGALLLALVSMGASGAGAAQRPGVKLAKPPAKAQRVRVPTGQTVVIGGFQTQDGRHLCSKSVCVAACEAQNKTCRTKPPYCNLNPFCSSSCSHCTQP